MNLRARIERVEACFHERFGGAPEVWVRAPGRVDLMGSHTDYNLGFVLTLPISRDAWIAARRRDDSVVRVYSMNVDEEDQFALDAIRRTAEPGWRNYVRGVAAGLLNAGYPLTGCDAVVHGNVPLESGLSSSAALECAVATLFEALGAWRISPERKAVLCQQAEIEFTGVNCGILDQYSSCLGQRDCALLLDCRDLSTRVAPIADGIRVMICNTMSRRRLTGGEYSQRRAECEQGARLLGLKSLRDASAETLARRRSELPDIVARRCEFIVAESARCEALARALEAGERAAIGRLCSASFAGARDLYEICSPAMSAMQDAMLAAPGLLGARQAGAGFGGCMVALVETARLDDFAAAVCESYLTSTGIRAEIYPVVASPGAGVFQPEG